MNDQELGEIRAELKFLRDKVVQLETAFNSGPGAWHICKVHAQEIADLKKLASGVGLKLAALSGVFAIIVFLATIFGPAMAAKVGLLVPVHQTPNPKP